MLSDECKCYTNKNPYPKFRILYDSLKSCIDSFPKFDELTGFLYLPSSFFDEIDNSLTNYYWYDCFDSFTTKSVLNLFHIIRENYNCGINDLIKNSENDLEALLTGKRQCYAVDEKGEKTCIPYHQKKLTKLHQKRIKNQSTINETEQNFFDTLESIIRSCKRRHENPQAYYESGALNFIKGHNIGAIEDAMQFIDMAQSDEKLANLAEAYFQVGEAYLETLNYDKAIQCLTKAIEHDQNNKKIYCERAVAYFELGNFDLALEDYLTSGFKPNPILSNSNEILCFSKGLISGILKGSMQAGADFLPSILSSLHGIGHGLWVFAQDPIQVSTEFVQAAQGCVNFIRENSSKESLELLVPEIKELIEKWDNFEDGKKGEITGNIIGKYGVNIFAGSGLLKCMKMYRDLRKANNLLTLDALALSEKNKKAITLKAFERSAQRKKLLQHANLKIEWDKQGKHIVGHKNFQTNLNKSIFQHNNPQKLIDKFSGKGMRIDNKQPGSGIYQEIINFDEFIGYAVDRETGEKIATCWGKIHYSKNGVHIVPTKPRI